MHPGYLTLLLPLIFCTCVLAPQEEPDVAALPKITVEKYYAGIELTTDGAQAAVVGVGKDTAGDKGYEVVRYLDVRGETDYLRDGELTSEEVETVLSALTELQSSIEGGDKPITATYAVTSSEYETAGQGEALRRAVAKQHPNWRVAANTPTLEAKANFYTMLGRSDIPFEETILVDIGGSNTIFSVLDSAGISAVRLDYGSRNIRELVDPIYQLNARREWQRIRLQQLVRDSVSGPVRRVLSRPAFARRHRFVFMGGLVYKIIKTLDVPLNGRPIDFSEASAAELPARIRDLLLSKNVDLSASPSYTPSELYAALVYLETITRQASRQDAAYFFERRTWLPGYILAQLEVASK